MSLLLNLNQLAELLMVRAELDDLEKSEKFIIDFFGSVAENLKKEKTVIIKSLGTFEIVDGSNGLIQFTPAPDIAAEVNSPFSVFNSVELNNGLTEELLVELTEKPDSTEEIAGEVKPQEDDAEETPAESVDQSESEASVLENKDGQIDETPETDEVAEMAAVENGAEESISSDSGPDDGTDNSGTIDDCDISEKGEGEESEKGEGEEDYDDCPENSADENVGEERKHVSGNSLWWLYLMLGMIMGFAACYFSGLHYDWETVDSGLSVPAVEADDDDQAKEAVVNDLMKTDSVKQIVQEEIQDTVVPSPEKEVTLDTVTSTRFLATMSRQHYGAMEFWVYIYIENADKLKDPERISPNTVVVIPPAEKYNIDPESEESRLLAKQKASEIYSKYGRH